ncbi:hypothetical protein GW17_00053108 [Ensete ventricosum]|nr:hypothetical protein GW17_00053108 [Ensete ventricosum]
MRLNRVESFNAFAARTSRRRGWPWLAARGSRLRPRPLQGGGWPRPTPLGVTDCSQGSLVRGLSATCKGRPPIGATARKWRPPVGAAGCGQPAGATASGVPVRDDRQRPARKRLPTAHPRRAIGGSRCPRGWPPYWETLSGRSYIPVFQIRMEKMKKVKHPPLQQYPHDGSLQ